MASSEDATSQMATALITTFLQAKMRDAKTSVALHSVSSDVDGAKIAQQNGNPVRSSGDVYGIASGSSAIRKVAERVGFGTSPMVETT